MTDRDLRRPGNRQDVITTLYKQLGKRDLSRSGPVGLSNPSDDVHDFEDVWEVLLREAGEAGQPQVTRV